MLTQPDFDFAGYRALDSARTLFAARELVPSWQGQYDSFCSIYAIINGLRLVLASIAPLPEGECQRLFRFGARILAERDELLACAQDGLELPSYRIVAQAMAERIAQRTGASITVKQPFESDDGITLDQVLTITKAAIDHGEVVLVSLLGAYDHYTVISGYSRTRLRLFDSYGYAWINIAACDVAATGATARHQIQAGSLLIFGATPTDLIAQSALQALT